MSCYLQLQRIMGQQSLGAFLGLHVDIDKVYRDNKRKSGKRVNGYLVNDGDKLTKELKVQMKEANHIKYGLSEQYIDYLTIPKACNVKVYELDKIMNSRKKLTTSEKIEHLLHVKEALEKRLTVLKSGQKIKEFSYLNPQQFAKLNGLKDGYEGRKLEESDFIALKQPDGEEQIEGSGSEIDELIEKVDKKQSVSKNQS